MHLKMTPELMRRLNVLSDEEFDRLFRQIEIPRHPEMFSEAYFRFEVRRLFQEAVRWGLEMGAVGRERGLVMADPSPAEAARFFPQ